MYRKKAQIPEDKNLLDNIKLFLDKNSIKILHHIFFMLCCFFTLVVVIALVVAVSFYPLISLITVISLVTLMTIVCMVYNYFKFKNHGGFSRFLKSFIQGL